MAPFEEEEVPKRLGPDYLGWVGSATIKGNQKVKRESRARARGTLLYVGLKLLMYHNPEFSSQLIEI